MHAGRRLFIKGGLALVALMSLPKALLAGAWVDNKGESDSIEKILD